ncbi:carboxymuconolactone decarboxylase family protein [Streptomyces sp. NBC_01235]|uniref:carboxymuconolactone decarboxylase family protein n=1 Tax=Streptomyces sp. NBC_01235 TaxID=2903788 RepID=UPI002E147EF6|nr:carboxymuconolactone decarboxylase family protein [Streptomyces sp. NBC_01235]
MSTPSTSTSTRVWIDKQSPQAYRALGETAQAVRETARAAGLDRTLVELVNIRVSQLTGCAYCLDVHVRTALRQGETTQRIAVLSAWRHTDLFTDQERAALALAESVTTLPDARIQDQDYAEAARHLTPEQISAVAWGAITMNAFNRLSIVSRHPIPPQATAAPRTSRAKTTQENTA